jgi:2-aminoadipate transaminase
VSQSVTTRTAGDTQSCDAPGAVAGVGDLIDLAVGEPDPSLLPASHLRKAALHRLATPEISHLMYGPEEGSASFRELLADFLTRNYVSQVQSNNLLITAGASHALDLVIGRLCRPGDTVFVEDPTYFFALDIFRDRHVRLVPVPTDAGGLDVDALDEMLAVEVPRLIYTIPVFGNPTGVTLGAHRRRRLIELAHRFGFLIVADEVYHLIGDWRTTPPPMRSLDGTHVLSVGSFSKIFGPGVRLGWIEGPPEHLACLLQDGALRSGGGVAPVMAAIVESAIALGLQDAYLQTVRQEYAARRRHVVDNLRRALPQEVAFAPPGGGFYIWLELPEHVDTRTLAADAHAKGVGFRPGASCSCRQSFANCMRLCFTNYDQPRLSVAVDRLGALLHTVCE